VTTVVTTSDKVIGAAGVITQSIFTFLLGQGNTLIDGRRPARAPSFSSFWKALHLSAPWVTAGPYRSIHPGETAVRRQRSHQTFFCPCAGSCVVKDSP
jgi:hypothetical protein